MTERRASLLLCVAALALLAGAQNPAARAESPAAAPPAAAAREDAWRENNLGVALLEQFRFGDAVLAFRRALARDPSLLPARINLAIAHLYVPDLAAAKQAAEAALAVAPDAPPPNYLLALIARAEGRAEDALPYVRKVLETDPKDLGANVTFGQVYLQMRQFDEAAAAFRVAIASEPYNVSAAYNLGVALTRAGKREEGQEAMAALPEAAGQRLQERARLELPRAGEVRGGPRLDGRGARAGRPEDAGGVARREGRGVGRRVDARPRGSRRRRCPGRRHGRALGAPRAAGRAGPIRRLHREGGPLRGGGGRRGGG